jgi:hypothetical protein
MPLLFSQSGMIYFRKRFDAQTLQEINEIICGVKPQKYSEDFGPAQTPPIIDGSNGAFF